MASSVPPRLGCRIWVRGVVQGVGFRPWIYRLAREEGLVGSVANAPEGVCIEVFGSEEEVERFRRRMEAEAPVAAQIRDLRWEEIPVGDQEGFVIHSSERSGQRQASIPPDLATCEACRAELADPRDRRWGYAFTNCTDCGPRYTIVREVPYDRPKTTMATFALCRACREEYEDVEDRRYHAQPNACPRCGPTLSVLDEAGEAVEVEELWVELAQRLKAGQILAIKGLGGFHLACDARDEEVVRELRRRKHREHKPFAVMVRDEPMARALAFLEPDEARLLASVQRPIVLLAALPLEESGLAPSVAPDTPTLGLILPYTPLHHLLMDAVGFPLVMTSANPSDEPMVVGETEALDRLRGIADAFLVHDRAIANPCDDSVARVLAGQTVLIRRARGWVPRGIPLAQPLAHPTLALGADLKSCFCLARGDTAWMGPHIGDLERPETLASLEESIARLESFLDLQPQRVVHDLHPGYHSTALARSLGKRGATLLGVQHHHAHAASVLAGVGLETPTLAVVYDGTGQGTDGRSWGAEVLRLEGGSFLRRASWRPIPLAGGDLAVRKPWRVALALLLEASPGDLELLQRVGGISEMELEAAQRQLHGGFHSPEVHSMGRLFDGVAALILGRGQNHYEGQLAMALECAAGGVEAPPYAVGLDRGPAGCWELDWRPLVVGLVEDMKSGSSAPWMAARFHAGISEATERVVQTLFDEEGRLAVVGSGGCFQNVRLWARLSGVLGARMPRELPANDGGIALGQVVICGALDCQGT